MMLPAGGQGRGRPFLAGTRRMQFAHALALGFLGVADTPALIGELEPGEFSRIYRLEGRSLEVAVGRKAWLAIGRPRRRLWQGGVGLLPLLRAAAQDRGNDRSEQHGRLSSRAGQARS